MRVRRPPRPIRAHRRGSRRNRKYDFYSKHRPEGSHQPRPQPRQHAARQRRNPDQGKRNRRRTHRQDIPQRRFIIWNSSPSQSSRFLYPQPSTSKSFDSDKSHQTAGEDQNKPYTGTDPVSHTNPPGRPETGANTSTQPPRKTSNDF